jgi:ribosomal protein S18 acetylase RimI-like enzyme
MRWQFRPASDSDRDFLFALHGLTMREVIAETWGWDETWQRADFIRRLDTCTVSIIDIEGPAAGCLWLRATPESLHIVELQLVPKMQGKGIGSAVVQHVIQQGIDRGVPVTLSVVAANPRAQRLYERLGFEVTGVDAPFIHMCAPPRNSSA